MKQDEKHWYFDGEPISHAGRVRAACGFYAHIKTEVNLRRPTCEVCIVARDAYENFADTFGDFGGNGNRNRG